MRFILVAGVLALALLACKKEAASPPSTEAIYQHGRAIYAARCTACHNVNSHEAGAVGPDIWGSPRGLIEARVMRAQYPDSYKPKRETHLMVALPDLANDIDALYAFLNDKH